MTDRINALTVVLDRDYRTDDVEDIVKAINMVRGVQSVTQHVANLGNHLAFERVKMLFFGKILEVFKEKPE